LRIKIAITADTSARQPMTDVMVKLVHGKHDTDNKTPSQKAAQVQATAKNLCGLRQHIHDQEAK
jgi:hypothetical protein